MIVGVPTETYPGERRVAIIPAVIPALTKAGLDVLVETGAGVAAGFLDTAYIEKGARIATDRQQVFTDADVILQVRCLGANPVAGRADLDLLRPGQTVIGFSEPLGEPDAARELAARGVSAFSMELIPRISRAQSMDALSSMATISGYKAVLLAASTLPRMFPMMMTAAGTVAPARVFVVGAGVAGLQAIASARRMGAKVEAYDVRPAVKEQVESLGATFVDLPLDTEASEDKGGYARAMDEEFYEKQRAALARVVAPMDVVICTAAIPGRKAPLLVTADAVRGMQPGSVIVDLAAETGGNCAFTRAGETSVEHGVTIIGPVNLPASVPFHASQMLSKNIVTFLLNMVTKEGVLEIDTEDEVVAGSLVTRDGDIVHPRVREVMGLPVLTPA